MEAHNGLGGVPILVENGGLDSGDGRASVTSYKEALQ